MSVDLREESLTLTALVEYAAISMPFVVDRMLEVRLIDGSLGGMVLTESAATNPHVKDYDAIEGAWPGAPGQAL